MYTKHSHIQTEAKGIFALKYVDKCLHSHEDEWLEKNEKKKNKRQNYFVVVEWEMV